MNLQSVPGFFAVPLRKLHFLKGNYRLLVFWPLIAVFISAVGWAALVRQLEKQENQIHAYALTEAASQSRHYADSLFRTLEAIDQIALHTRFDWKITNGELRLDEAAGAGLFPPSSIFFVAVVDADGRVLTSTAPDVDRTYLGDRRYFLEQKNATTDSLYVGPVHFGRISKRYTLLFSRRISDEGGRFTGIVLISVTPAYFTTAYDSISLGAHGLMGMAGTDGSIRVVRTGDHVHAANSAVFNAVPRFSTANGADLFVGKEWFADGRNRYVGWHQVHGYPLNAIIGLDQQAVMAPYWASRTSAIRNAVAASLALLLFTMISMALSMRLAWRKRQTEIIQATYRMATEEGTEGFYTARPIYDASGSIIDFQIVDCNQRGAEIYRQRREEFIGARISALHAPADAGPPMKILCHAMAKGFYDAEVKQPENGPVAPRWLHVKVIRSNGDLAVRLRDISDAKAHVEQLERRGNEDALTGLPNRHWMLSYLPRSIEGAAARNEMLAVLFIDLDGFKVINDTMGHPAGDELLRHAARRLKDAVRPHDSVVRFGGDEFVVIIERILHQEDAAHIAQRILQAFQEKFRLRQGEHHVGTSIGISVFPSDGTDSESLLQNADIAMYSVKTSGKRSYRFFDPDFYEALRVRLERESELRRAIEHDEFIMYYQPRIDLSTGHTSSMEALLRWQHPSRGIIEPGEFIPLAESTGLIVALGGLAIDKVCAQIAQWEKTSESIVPVSINVSPRQFNETDIIKAFSESLARYGIAPELLEIELTESSMMSDSQDVSVTLGTIRELGIKLLVDDFGTGYSSLSQLQELDFDVLKVDRAFTARLAKSEKGNVFFTAIVTMAHALGMKVVAEGVETLEQMEILKSLGCDEVQGFYISKPVPAGDMQNIFRTPSVSSTP